MFTDRFLLQSSFCPANFLQFWDFPGRARLRLFQKATILSLLSPWFHQNSLDQKHVYTESGPGIPDIPVFKTDWMSLKLENISKGFGRKQLLNEVFLEMYLNTLERNL